MEGIFITAAFWLMAVVTLCSALLVITCKNLVHSVLWLIVTFLGVAGLFFSLDAPFLAAIQVLVYAGAVCIMVIFGVMLTKRDDINRTNLFNNRLLLGAPAAGLLLVVIGLLVNKSKVVIPVVDGTVPQDTVGNIAELMLTKYVVPFEAAAVLLLAALIGAVFLSMEVKNRAGND